MTYADSTPYLDHNWFDAMTQATTGFPIRVDFISTEIANVICLVNFFILSSVVALFGICANIINMIVFYIQGINSTNISFFALAISDICCLVTGQSIGVFFVPFLDPANVNFVRGEVVYLSGGWTHICGSRITSWITVFITAERCLGIALPLKVKQIVTLRRRIIVVCLIFAVNISTVFPEYISSYYDWKFVPAQNRTLYGLVFRSEMDYTYGMAFILTSVSGQMSFVCVTLSTVFLVTKLTQKSTWRNQATGGSDKSDAVSTRDKRTMKMIIMIASVLIVCYIPGTVVSLVPSFVPEFVCDGALSNSFLSFWSIAFVFDTINSSINAFLYYRMSTKYRHTFNKLFSRYVNTDNDDAEGA